MKDLTFKVLFRVSALLVNDYIRNSRKLPVLLERMIERPELYELDEF